jgi:hypothetical protein
MEIKDFDPMFIGKMENKHYEKPHDTYSRYAVMHEKERRKGYEMELLRIINGLTVDEMNELILMMKKWQKL